MSNSSELYRWQPADKHLAELICKGKNVIIKQENEVFAIIPNSLLTAIGEEMVLKCITDSKWEYLSPTAPEVKELPDCEGWWWVWDDNRQCWDKRYIEMKNDKPHDLGRRVKTAYCIEIQKPDFNPITGENL